MWTDDFVPPSVFRLIDLAIEEDLGRGDLTSLAVPESAKANARIVAKSDLTVSGLVLVEPIFRAVGLVPERLERLARDGERLERGREILRFRGPARTLLGVERTLLNFLQRSSGVATLATQFHQQLESTRRAHPDRVRASLRVVDTRKTMPGFRWLDKRAVKDGGLANHRFGLDSGVLLKENHLRAAGGISAAVRALEGKVPHGISVEVEVTNREEAFEAVEAGVQFLLLDNFSVADLNPLVRELRNRREDLVLEASGNLSLLTLSDYAQSGVDILSVGALTHSAPAADLSLLFDFV